jgi:hypothetical protein
MQYTHQILSRLAARQTRPHGERDAPGSRFETEGASRTLSAQSSGPGPGPAVDSALFSYRLDYCDKKNPEDKRSDNPQRSQSQGIFVDISRCSINRHAFA